MIERVLFAGGGTGGHIYMAVALANKLKQQRPPTGVLFVGARRGVEKNILPALGFPFQTISLGGLKGVGPLRALYTLLQLPPSLLASRKILTEFSPSIVVGLGGYSSAPVIAANRWLGHPSLIIEPNVYPGLANRLAARWVDGAAVAFEETARWFAGRARLTGVPVREEFHRMPSEISSERPLRVLVFGGSQGSRPINRLLCEALPFLAREEVALVHQTGLSDFFAVRQRYQQEGFPAEVKDFIQDMPAYFARADLLLSRAGASTLAEITAAGKAALLIPFPRAADDHQRKNARALAEKGAALVLEQDKTTGQELARLLVDLSRDRPRLRRMSQASKQLARPRATEEIIEFMEELVQKRLTDCQLSVRLQL